MSNSYPYPEALMVALSPHWSTVLPLNVSEGRQLVAAFVGGCVREEFAKKFMEAFNGHRPLTSRLFRGHVEKRVEERIDEIFECLVPAPLEAEVLWGSLQEPIAFSLRGKVGPPLVSSLFVDEGDALARVSLAHGRTGFLLLTGARGQLFRFPKQIQGGERLRG
jgi:hypothetical protein